MKTLSFLLVGLCSLSAQGEVHTVPPPPPDKLYANNPVRFIANGASENGLSGNIIITVESKGPEGERSFSLTGSGPEWVFRIDAPTVSFQFKLIGVDPERCRLGYEINVLPERPGGRPLALLGQTYFVYDEAVPLISGGDKSLVVTVSPAKEDEVLMAASNLGDVPRRRIIRRTEDTAAPKPDPKPVSKPKVNPELSPPGSPPSFVPEEFGIPVPPPSKFAPKKDAPPPPPLPPQP